MTDRTASKRKRRPVADRLWEKVDRTGDGCWEYPGHPSKSGHTQIWYSGTMRLAHRVAWEVSVGAIPGGLCVLHHCDNPPCVRPDHLFLGTVGDNNADRDQKGRHVALKGERNGESKLTADDVRAIRAGYVFRKTSMYALAEQYGVNQGAIWQVIHRRTWTHVE